MIDWTMWLTLKNEPWDEVDVWVKQPDVSCVTRECAATCTFQGVLIQFGDLASAYSVEFLSFFLSLMMIILHIYIYICFN